MLYRSIVLLSVWSWFGCTTSSTTLEPVDLPDGSVTVEDIALVDASVQANDDAPRERVDDVDGGSKPALLDVSYPTAPKMIGGDRPCEYRLPKQYTSKKQWPLIVLLHGYQVDGVLQDMFFGLSGLVDELGFLMIRPNGTVDSQGYNFWNGTFACCDRDQVNIDDAGYIHSLIDEMETYFNVDPSRIYLMGHSNGGFMSYRLACETGERFAGLMSLAGATFYDEKACDGVAPLAVLQVHGTNDTEIKYDGGKIKGIMPYPSAEETVSRWTMRNGCGDPVDLPNIDIDADIDGDETTVRYWSDCASGFDVGLWTIQEGKHIPGVYDGRFSRAAIAFLFAHKRDVTSTE